MSEARSPATRAARSGSTRARVIAAMPAALPVDQVPRHENDSAAAIRLRSASSGQKATMAPTREPYCAKDFDADHAKTTRARSAIFRMCSRSSAGSCAP